jgi:AdoMet dependent proline di-methyltransferase
LMAAGLPTEPAVHVDLLDPSAFSIAEARRVLAAPFVAADEHEVVIQDFDRLNAYDVAWATHALYALAPDELAAGIARMTAALRPGGFGVVALAGSRSHYLRFYEAYRPAFAPAITPYADAESAAAALRSAGADVDVQLLRYRTTSSDRAVVEGFLQRCAFDDTVSLEQMETREPLAGYLAGCRTADGSYEFRHEVHLITWEQDA